MSIEKMYSVAIRKRENSTDFFWDHDDFVFHELKIDCQNRYWLADPFLFEKDNKTYVFYEAYDMIQHKGKIGYSILNKKNKTLPIHIIIDEPHHLSFPYLFEHNGDIFIMPETCDDNSIKLYKSMIFPDKWEMSSILLSDIYSCDTILMPNNNPCHMITCEMYKGETPNGNYSSCWVKNKCYRIDDKLQIIGEGKYIGEGDCGYRNAGKTFIYHGKNMRVGQNCPDKQYGKGIVLFEIQSVDPYQESLIWIKNCSELEPHIHRFVNNSLIGVHTYNISEHYEVIDFSQYRNYSPKRKLLLVKKIKRKIKTIITNFYEKNNHHD